MRRILSLLCLCFFGFNGFALSTLGNAGGIVAAGSICLPGVNSIIASFSITQTVAVSTLNTVNFTTTGTYLAADVTDFKLYANTVNNFATATQVGATLVAGLGTGAHTFSPAYSLSSIVPGSNITYYWIVVDAPVTATLCNTLGVSAFVAANIAVSVGGTAGTTAISGTQTFNSVPVVTATATPGTLCQGSNLTLTGTGTGCGNTYSWTGPGGSGYSSAVLNPAAFATILGDAGVFNLSATNICGTGTASTASVVINPQPTGVTATAAPNPVCTGSNLTLTGTATGAATYAWTGPSAYSSAVLNPPSIVASASSAGVYMLTATTALGCTASASTASVVVNSQPTGVTATASPLALCTGNNLTLSGTGVGGTAPTYTWTGPGIVSLAGMNPAAFPATLANTGIFTLTASVLGCADVSASTASVVVNTMPSGVTAAAAPNPVCSGSNLTLSGTATGATSYTWTGPTGIVSTNLNPGPFVVTSGDAGVYTLSASGGGSCIVTANTAAVVVNTQPAITAIASPNPVCEGGNLTLSGISVGGSSPTYAWTGPGIVSTPGLNPAPFVATLANAGVFILTASVAGCADVTAGTLAVTVNALPTGVTAAAAPNPVCSGGNLTLTGTATGATSYSWTNPSGTVISALLNPAAFAVSGADAGVYVLTASNGIGCSVTASTAPVVVNSQPTGVTATAAPNPVCTGSNLTLSGTSVGGSAPTYAWTGPGIASTPGLNPAAFATTAANAGIYTLTASVLGCADVIASTAAVTVNAIPTGVTATASPNPVCSGSDLTLTGTAIGAVLYSWIGPAASAYSASVLNPPAFIANNHDAGVFTLTVTNGLGCSATASTAAVVVDAPPPSISGSMSLCAGTTSNYTDVLSGGTWSSSDPVAATISPTGVVTALAPGTTDIMYTFGGCSTSLPVVVNLAPPSITVAPHVSSICNDGSVMLTVSAPPTPDTVSRQNFNAGLTTWSVDNSGSVATLGGTGWRACGNGYTNEIGTFHSPDNSGFAMVNADTSGSGSTTVSQLFDLPRFSLAGYTSATLSFQLSYQYYSVGDNNAEIDASTDGGVTWSTIYDYKAAGVSVGTPTSFATQTLSLDSYLGLNNVELRFYYNSSWGYYFAVDNVYVTGSPMSLSPTWSPTTDLFTDAALTVPYVGGTSEYNVYVHPTSVVATTSTTYTATVIYSGCSATDTANVTVNPIPAAITGTDSMCVSTTTVLSDVTPGGAWSSQNFAIATVDAVTGVVTGVSAGNDTITYSVGGCYVTYPVFVKVSPPTGVTATAAPNPLRAGDNLFLTGTATGGTSYLWAGPGGFTSTVLNPAGFSAVLADAGIYSLTATSVPGCSITVTTAPVVVNLQPTAVTASASPLSMCAGSNLTLAGTATGGSSPTFTWTGPGIVPVVGLTPVPFAVFVPNSGVYTLTASVAGCADVIATTSAVTVNAIPTLVSATAAPNPVCSGANLNLSGTASGATIFLWSGPAGSGYTSLSLNPAPFVASATSAGIYTLTATNASGCSVTAMTSSVVVSGAIAAITGTDSLCAGNTTLLSDLSFGGTWSSSNAAISSISAGGLVTALSPGIATITYTLGACVQTLPFIVRSVPNPGIITGLRHLCTGSTDTLVDTVSGGTWNASNGNATISATGLVTGVSNGIDTFTYVVTNMCGLGLTNFTDTISAPANSGFIVGPTSVCAASFAVLTDTATGGTWSVSNTRATIDSTGLFSALSSGVDTVYYSEVTACSSSSAMKVISINPLPDTGVISGSPAVCIGFPVTLSETGSGGVWSSEFATATVSATGVVTGITPGLDTILYSVTNGCGTRSAKFGLVVNAGSAGTITGPTFVCVGAAISLSDTAAGGSFSSGSARAIVTTSGVVTGVFAGVDTITYTLIETCGTFATTRVITIEPIPAPSGIMGITTLCTGGLVTLTDSVAGGKWFSANASVASIDSNTGVLQGISMGSTNIDYHLMSAYGCIADTFVTVTINAAPSVMPVMGTTNECKGATTTFTDETAGGIWLSSDTTIAFINASGVVTGLNMGAVTISYVVSAGAGCSAISTINDTVNITPFKSAIMGNKNLCLGNFTTLSDSVLFGTWSSMDTAIASVNALTGLVTGTGLGNTLIVYSISNICGSAIDSALVSVSVAPAIRNITGNVGIICAGGIVALHDSTTGGAWAISDTTIAKINPSTGVVTGISAGNVVVSYTVTTATCSVTKLDSLTFGGTLSASIAPMGSVTMCQGSDEHLQVVSTGSGLSYQWYDHNVAIAGATNNSYNAADSGYYTAFISSAACSEFLTGTEVASAVIPSISFTAPNKLTTGAFVSYQWFKSGVIIPGATSGTYYAAKNGSYYVVVTTLGGCSDTSKTYNITDIHINGVATINAEDDYSIYPNPATSILFISAPRNVNVMVYAPDGKLVSKKENTNSVDVSDLANGLYVIKIFDENNVLVKTAKFTKL